MDESTFLREVRDQGRLEVWRDTLTQVLLTRLSGDQLKVALPRVEQQTDLAILSRWFTLSLMISPEAIIVLLQKEPPRPT
jgi:hypothetical protein